MSKQESIYIENLESTAPEGTLVEKNRVVDIRDDKWAHPISRETGFHWGPSEDMLIMSKLYNPTIPLEERQALGKENNDKIEASICKHDARTTGSEYDIREITIPGCPEEPEASVIIKVVRPKSLKSKKTRCLFNIAGGAMVTSIPRTTLLEYYSKKHDCVVVSTKYRTILEKAYPAAVNDLHASYMWMVENAAELGINPDNIVIEGTSSGGMLALTLGFRLKRYGYSPKGVVAFIPQTDDKENDHKGVYHGDWDSVSQHDELSLYVGKNLSSSLIGPEALPNRATVTDCIGYPPCFINTFEFDPDRHFTLELVGKMMDAETFVEYHVWPGAHHRFFPPAVGVYLNPELVGSNKYGDRVSTVFHNNIDDCFKYDLRRPWVKEQLVDEK